jgi:dTDP-4-amino-4,6-dideoxygalactose transaminase
MVPFNDLKPRYDARWELHEAAASRVFRRGWYVLGPELEAFEHEFAAYHGGGHAAGVANGTDAIELALRAAGVGPGDEVITVAHTAVATVCAVERSGAKAVLVDVDPRTYTIDPAAVRAAITPRTKAIVPVHLYGHPVDMDAILEVAARANLLVVEDCAQAHGARWLGRKVGTLGHVAAFSFYPTKNLGAFGDGGAVLTSDAALAERVRRLRNYGQTERYHHVDPGGFNSRLDELHAAYLRVSLQFLDADNGERRRIAAIYQARLRGVEPPRAWPGEDRVHHVYHLYVVRHPDRNGLQERLKARGVGTLVHYPIPVHLQPAYAHLGMIRGDLPVTERLAGEILSLPMYAGLRDAQIEVVVDAVNGGATKEAA